VDTAFECGEGEAIIEVNIGDERHRCLPDDLRHGGGGLLVRHRDPHDIDPGIDQPGDLLQRGFDIGGVGGGHRLHADRGIAADQDIADPYLAGLSTLGQHECPSLLMICARWQRLTG
jgi:hypothetical protein